MTSVSWNCHRDYEAEQAELKKRAAALQAELDKSQAATVNAEKFMGIVRKHLAFEELTPTLLREMIEKIVVHECSYDENGTRRQDIEIYYSFVGKIDLPNNRPTYPTQWPSARIGTAKFFTLLLLLYHTQAKSQGMKQLVAGAGVAVVGMVLVPLLSGLFTV